MNQDRNQAGIGSTIHKQRPPSQARTDLTGLNNEELLSQLANSPCANREIAKDQSLEEYLREVKPKK